MFENKYVKFWKWFSKKQKYLFAKCEESMADVISDISKEITKVDKNIALEIGVLCDGYRELTISANGIADSFASVIDLVETSPKYESWKTVAFRQPIFSDGALSIRMGGDNLSYEDIKFLYAKRDGYLDLEIYIKGFNENNKIQHIYFILLDTLLGEYLAVSRIGNTTIHDLASYSGDDLLEFKQLRELIDDLVSSDINNLN